MPKGQDQGPKMYIPGNGEMCAHARNPFPDVQGKGRKVLEYAMVAGNMCHDFSNRPANPPGSPASPTYTPGWVSKNPKDSGDRSIPVVPGISVLPVRMPRPNPKLDTES